MPSSPTARQGVDCIVVGSGLAGLTAAIICLDRGGKVLLLEKEAKLGGNSIKASSGINACPADDDGIASKEEIDAFVQDTMKSAGKGANSQLIETLVTNSAIALKWLNDRIEVDLLQSRTRLGGHSRERTHRPVKGAVGFSVINGMQKALKLFQENVTLEIMTETALTGLIPTEDSKSVIGVTAQHGSDESSHTWFWQLEGSLPIEPTILTWPSIVRNIFTCRQRLETFRPEMESNSPPLVLGLV
jgi:FAD-dependent fumarate reductase